ncbi:MAG TPA: hypothetical protein VF246_04230 [Acidimicrobiia bacterium]|jgi:hypothetical protein
MSNTAATQPVAVAPAWRWLAYLIAAVVLAVAAFLVFQTVASTPVAEEGLTRAQQAERDRYQGMADAYREKTATGAATAEERAMIDPHESPEISRVPAASSAGPQIDPHESPEISRVRPNFERTPD